MHANLRKTLVFIFHISLIIIFGGYITTLLTQSSGIMTVLPNEGPSRFFVEDNTKQTHFIDNPSNYTIILNTDTSSIKKYYVNYDPIGKKIVFSGFILLTISSILLLKKINYKIVIGALILAAIYFVVRYSFQQLPPILQSSWLFFHVISVMTAYSLFLYISIAAICSKRKPSLAILRWGVTLLAIGIVLGSIWASQSWGSYWNWDPKETWALITLLIYAVPFHQRYLSPMRQNKIIRIYVLLAFLCVLMTYFGVNYFLGGMHSYAHH